MLIPGPQRSARESRPLWLAEQPWNWPDPSPPYLLAANRVNITNNSQQTSGGMLLVSGTNQQVGAIDGTGDTVVNDGSDLTANHIIQNALVIGGTAGQPALVTIDASDASGNPLGQSSGLALAGSLTSSGPSEPSVSAPPT